MKKTLTIIMTVMAAMALRGQTPPAPPLDTIVGREITYFYNNNEHCGKFGYCYVGSNFVHAQQYITDSTLRIKGLAICAKEGTDHASYIAGPSFSDSIVRLYVLEAGSGHLIEMAHTTVNLNRLSRWMTLYGTNWTESHTALMGEGEWTFPVIETFFDSIVTIEDSFYIGFGPVHPRKDSLQAIHLFQDGAIRYPSWCPVPLMCAYDMITSSWTYYSSWYTGGRVSNWGIYPILDSVGWSYYCDTMVCPRMGELNVSEGYGMVVCSWIGDTLNGHGKWQLSYGPVGTEPGYGHVITTTALSRVLNDLEDTVTYVAYVRGYCTACHKWGEWSDGVEFRVLGHEGVQTVESGQRVRVVPNPSRGRVEVTSSCGLQRVTVYDASGAFVLTQRAAGEKVALDFGGYPAGIYFVVANTPAGMECRKLVIEKNVLMR